MSRGPFGAYLFDLDGTLIDSIDLIFRAYRHTAERHLAISPPDSVWREGLGTPLRQQLAAVCEDPDLIEVMVATYREYHFAHHEESVKAYPDVVDVVAALSGRGAQLGVVTSKLRNGAERGLVAAGLLEFFHTIVSADEVSRHKPHPEPVLAALERLGVDAGDAVFIGDSPTTSPPEGKRASPLPESSGVPSPARSSRSLRPTSFWNLLRRSWLSEGVALVSVKLG